MSDAADPFAGCRSIDELDAVYKAEFVRLFPTGFNAHFFASDEYWRLSEGHRRALDALANRHSEQADRARENQARQAERYKANNPYTKIRAWAAEHGYELGVRGRVPQHIIDAYNAAKGE